MSTLKLYRNCSTAGIRQLDLQMIGQIQRIAPNVLVSFKHLNIKAGQGCHCYLQAPAVRALGRAIAKRRKTLEVNSDFRTICQQSILYGHFLAGRCGITAAAKPGRSNHESGLAIDIEDHEGWKPYLEEQGFDWLGSWDDMHFDFKGNGCKDLSFIQTKAFQQLYNLNNPQQKIAEDGKLGILTQLALGSAPQQGFKKLPVGFRELEDSDKPKLNVTALEPLRNGSTGTGVLGLQGALKLKGYAIAEDGRFGSATEAIVRRFQSDAGITADGVVGSATWRALGVG